MVVYTKLDDNCELQKENGSPVLDFYWMMKGSDYKPLHSAIKSGIRDRLQLLPTAHNDRFMVQINDLKEVQTDIEDPRITVVGQPDKKGGCQVHALMTLGASDKNAVVQLTSIYSDASKTFLPPFRKLKSITIHGTDVKTGEKVDRTYNAK
ncbi:MAG: hypothetical protein EOP06_24365 [Proteobacteria bacterium]|nr:MAG: hypothetical protein EOP06_24365 [Pseudomonadota bacterium]